MSHRHPAASRPAAGATVPGTPARTLFATTALLASLALAGCNPQPASQTVGQRTDAAVERSQEKLEEAKKSAGEATQAAGTALTDTAITASVKAQLAADPDLKMLDISVETEAGRTRLRGTAPTEAARERATRIAGAVSGVASVDNELSVKP
jgi:osmotically-inducible protein OsmY